MLDRLRIKIFADGADVRAAAELARDPRIRGFTTNPTLMRKAGVTDYEAFGRALLDAVPDKPVCFEVITDDFDEMARQARVLRSWGDNVVVKIPVTDTRGRSAGPVVEQLLCEGVPVNITAVLAPAQLHALVPHVPRDARALVSVFAGRIADTGVDPVPVVQLANQLFAAHAEVEILWASCREVLNIVQADTAGCDAITVTHDLLAKLDLLGAELAARSLDTVRQFHDDAEASGLAID